MASVKRPARDIPAPPGDHADADAEVLRQRILGSDEAREWRLAHLASYQEARCWLIEVADLVVDTGAHNPAEVACQIADALSGLMPNLP